MYSAEELAAYPFFAQLLRDAPSEAIHDSLTGLIARPFMLRFVRDLIERGEPFTLAILDLDNFKAVNDSCGHKVGDRVLARAAEDLREYVGSDGIVGRYGGDEFLLAYHKCAEYDGVHDFFLRMYHSGRVFRRELSLDGAQIYLSATAGSACYPKDAGDYDGLFLLCDKTLYRGKQKGRNCFINYVAAKHASLEIPTLTKRSLYRTIRAMAEGFDSADSARQKLWQAFVPMRANLNLDRLLLLDGDGRLTDAENGALLAQGIEADVPAGDGLCALPLLDEPGGDRTPLHETLSGLSLGTALLVRVAGNHSEFRYLVLCPEPHTNRIWQDDEFSAAFILARMLSQYLKRF